MVQIKPHPPFALVNARLIDPEKGVELRGGVLVKDGLIRDFGAGVTAESLPEDIPVFDCGGDVLSPGLIDLLGGVAVVAQPQRVAVDVIPALPSSSRSC